MSDKLRVLIGTIPLQLIFGLIYVWGSVSPYVLAQSGWSSIQVNLVFALTPLATVPAVLVGGRLADKYPLKQVLIGAMSFFTFGTLLAFLFFNPVIFIVGYSVIALGFGAGLSTPSSLAAVTRTFPRIPGTMAGLLMAIYGMSAMVVAPIFTLLTYSFDWVDSLKLICFTLAILGWLGVLIMPNLPSQHKETKQQDKKWTDALKHQRLMMNVAALIIAAPVGSIIYAEIGNLTSTLTTSPFFISLSIVSMSIGNGIGRFLGGLVADRLGVILTRNIILWTTIISGVGFLALSNFLSGLMFIAIFLGLGFGGLSGMLSPLAIRIIPESPHFGFGFLFSGFALGSFIGPILSSYVEMTILLPILTVATIVIMIFIKKRESTLFFLEQEERRTYGS